MQVCKHPIDKFRISDNSRRHVFCWLLAKLLLGINTPITDEELMKVLWKVFESTCENGHRYAPCLILVLKSLFFSLLQFGVHNF